MFSHSVGKPVGETEKLWGILNETKQEMREIQEKKNKHDVGGNSSASDEGITGNAQSYFNSTNKRLERLENESRSLIEEFKIIRMTAENFSDTEMKVSTYH